MANIAALPTVAGEGWAFSKNPRKGPCRVRLQLAAESHLVSRNRDGRSVAGTAARRFLGSVVLISALRWDQPGVLVAAQAVCVAWWVGRSNLILSPSRLAQMFALNSQCAFCLGR